MQVGMYFITPMLLLLFLVMCRHRRRWGRSFKSPLNANNRSLRPPIDIIVKPFCFTIAYGVPNIDRKTVFGFNTQQFSWQKPGDNESILPVATSIVDMMILSIENDAIAGLPDPGWMTRELSGCREQPNGDDGHHSCNVTPIFNNISAAG